MKPLSIGLIGLDTSHCIALTQRWNDPSHAEHVPGGRVVCAFPGGSPQFELSAGRVPAFTSQLRDQFGVDMLATPEDVAERADLLMITSLDGRVHLDQFERTVRFGKPTFIDKPMAIRVADAVRIFELAEAHGVPVMSTSSLRYAEPLVAALLDEAPGRVVGCDVFGPMDEEPLAPGLFWYGIHSVEMMVRIIGVGVHLVSCVRHLDVDLVTVIYGDGRVASIHGVRRAHAKFGAIIHREKDVQLVNISASKRSYYHGLATAIVRSLPARQPDVPAEETLEVLRIIEAANNSRDNAGKAIQIRA